MGRWLLETALLIPPDLLPVDEAQHRNCLPAPRTPLDSELICDDAPSQLVYAALEPCTHLSVVPEHLVHLLAGSWPHDDGGVRVGGDGTPESPYSQMMRIHSPPPSPNDKGARQGREGLLVHLMGVEETEGAALGAIGAGIHLALREVEAAIEVAETKRHRWGWRVEAAWRAVVEGHVANLHKRKGQAR